MIIRKMRADEVQKVKEIIDSVFNVRISIDQLADTLSNRAKKTLVGIVNNKIVCTVGIRSNNKIVWLAVLPEHRRKGYTKKLIMDVLWGLNHPYLNVKKDNLVAIELYQSLGFDIVGTYKNHSFRMEY